MKFLVTGGAGFIGTILAREVRRLNHEVRVLDLVPPAEGTEFVRIDLAREIPTPEQLGGADAVIHLAGKNIFSRWNARRKKEIYDSRILSTRNLVAGIAALERKPSVLVSASAVGYYGDRGEEELLESSPPGDDFLAHVCIDWEREAERAEHFGVRSVRIRTAPVVGRGGFLATMLPFHKAGLGGPLGNGRQWFPWIHIADICGIYIFAAINASVRGPLNSCSPHRLRNREFSDTLGRVVRRPAFLRVPKLGLRILYGELGNALIASQNVDPRKLLNLGYVFRLPALEEALRDALGPSRP